MSVETRYPCPVCLGPKMEKVVLQLDGQTSPKQLVLDHCGRCGGVWFGAGEVQQLHRCESELLWREIVRREDPVSMRCHSCRSPIARDVEACEVCGWVVELDCPTCSRPLSVEEHAGMRLDYCRHCKGVWFDHNELAGIWRQEMKAALARRPGSRAARAASEGGDALLDALMFDPFLMYYGMHAGAHIAGAAAEGLMHAGGGVAEGIGGVAEVAAEAASSVFETIVEIIAGIFG